MISFSIVLITFIGELSEGRLLRNLNEREFLAAALKVT